MLMSAFYGRYYCPHFIGKLGQWHTMDSNTDSVIPALRYLLTIHQTCVTQSQDNRKPTSGEPVPMARARKEPHKVLCLSCPFLPLAALF